MLFNSLTFLAFFAAFLVAYFATRGRLRLWVCLVASYVFYGWWDWRFLGLIAISTAIDYVVGLKLDAATGERRRKRLVTISVAANLGFLFFFKYFGFFTHSLHDAFAGIGVHVPLPALEIVLPVGISFYTFQTMSYSIDLYRRRLEVEPDLVNFAVFVAFFPQLVAGPIVRASTLLPQLRETQPFEEDRVVQGAQLAVWGFVKKVVVADNLAPYVDACFAAPEAYGSLSLALAVFFYAFQIYCDFSGYSDIAIGLARMLGFDFPVNFNRPYFARDFSDFWQRWHISLSSWLRDYLYIPLGGNRGGTLFTYRNLCLTMLLGGLWHGAAWTFVIWGALHGGYLVAQRLWPSRITSAAERAVGRATVAAFQIGLTFVLTCIAWVFFRAVDLSTALTILGRIVDYDGVGFAALPSKFILIKGLLLITALLTVDLVSDHPRLKEIYVRRKWMQALAMAVGLWSIALLGSFDGNRFIYFQF